MLKSVPSALGVISLMVLVSSWIAQSEVASHLETNLGYSKPAFITYMNHSWTALLLLLLLKRRRVQIRFNRNICVLGILLATIYWTGDYLWYIGLTKTSVGVGTALFNTNCVFVYVLSYFFLKEKKRFSRDHFLSLLLTVSGVVLVACDSKYNKSDESTTSDIWGSIMIVLASFSYAMYEVMLSFSLRREKIEETLDVSNAANGAMGMLNIVLMWIPVLFLCYVPPENSSFYEKFSIPNREQAMYLFLNGFLAFLFNVSFVASLSLTSAFITSIACVTTIPLAAITDFFLWGDIVGWYFISGSVLIIIGFIVLLVVSSFDVDVKAERMTETDGNEEKSEDMEESLLRFAAS